MSHEVKISSSLSLFQKLNVLIKDGIGFSVKSTLSGEKDNNATLFLVSICCIQ